MKNHQKGLNPLVILGYPYFDYFDLSQAAMTSYCKGNYLDLI